MDRQILGFQTIETLSDPAELLAQIELPNSTISFLCSPSTGQTITWL